MPRILKFNTLLAYSALLTVALYTAQARSQGMFDDEELSGEVDTGSQNRDSGKSALLGSDRSYPSASIGFKLELLSFELGVIDDDLNNSLPSFSYPVAIEGSFDIISRLSIFGAFGMYVFAHTTDIDGDETKLRAGLLMFQGGARFNIMEPRAKHAHLYVGADFTGVVGIATDEADGEDDDDAEKRAKEQWDHLLWGVALGIQYMVSADFSVASELGFRMLYNDLEDVGEVMGIDNIDSYRYIQLFTAFGLRLSYHF